jgi:hypothetical protein
MLYLIATSAVALGAVGVEPPTFSLGNRWFAGGAQHGGQHAGNGGDHAAKGFLRVRGGPCGLAGLRSRAGPVGGSPRASRDAVGPPNWRPQDVTPVITPAGRGLLSG